MRVGIVTVYDSANYGSYLQAYALKTTLEEMGHIVFFIKVRSEKEVRKLFFGTKREWKKYLTNYVENYKKYQKFLEDRIEFREIELEDVNEKNIDYVLYGSDEIWNVCTNVFQRGCFYGENIKVPKLAYAVSVGKAQIEDFKKYPNLQKDIMKFEKIFVRDSLTKKVIEQITGKEWQQVCDPTFLIDGKKMKKAYQNPIKEPYLLVYAYTLPKQIQEYVIRYAKEKKLKLVSACMKQDWCDETIICSPLEFSTLVAEAKLVVTATFHGSIFSFLNESRFVALAELPKVKDILKLVGLENVIIKSDCTYEEFCKKAVTDYEKTQIREIIQRERKNARLLLERELQDDRNL